MRLLLAAIACLAQVALSISTSGNIPGGGYVTVSSGGAGAFVSNTMVYSNYEAPSAIGGSSLSGASVVLVTQTLNGGKYAQDTVSFAIGQSPCLHITATKTSFSGSSTITPGTTNNFNESISSQYLVLSHAYLYNETNGVKGVQAGETVGKPVGLCSGILASSKFSNSLAWDPFTFSSFSQGNTLVYLFQKCVTINNSTWGSFGKMCFNFSVGNGSYTFNGVQRLFGEMKLDQVYYPSAAVQSTGLYYGLGGNYFTSSDSISGSITLNANNNYQQGTNSFSFQPNVLVNFNSGSQAYLNWVTTVSVNTAGTVSSANVNVQNVNASNFQGTFNFSADAASFAGAVATTQSIILFDFLTPLTNVNSITWDPSTGYVTSGSTTTKAAIAPNAATALLVTCFAILFAKRMM